MAEPERGVIERYEQAFAERLGVEYAIAFNNGRSALRGILAAAGLGEPDEIILAPLTCEVVPLALLAHPVRPVYADLGEGTLNLDARAVAAAIRPATGAVLFQHTYGTSTGVEAVATVAAQHGLLLIEDCAQAMPLRSAAEAPGQRGQAAIFSLNLVKPLAAGSGGMAITGDSGLASRIRGYRDRLPARRRLAGVLQGLEAAVQRAALNPTTYWDLWTLQQRLRRRTTATLTEAVTHRITRTATRISPGQARQGLRALARVAHLARIRAANCSWYATALPDALRLAPPGGPPAPWFYYPLLVPSKQTVLRLARRRRIEVVAWPDRTPFYGVEQRSDLAQYGYRPGSCPTAETTASRLVGLPTGADVAPRHRHRIARLLSEAG